VNYNGTVSKLFAQPESSDKAFLYDLMASENLEHCPGALCFILTAYIHYKEETKNPGGKSANCTTGSHFRHSFGKTSVAYSAESILTVELFFALYNGWKKNTRFQSIW
jgi:hypothetical protein